MLPMTRDLFSVQDKVVIVTSGLFRIKVSPTEFDALFGHLLGCQQCAGQYAHLRRGF